MYYVGMSIYCIAMASCTPRGYLHACVLPQSLPQMYVQYTYIFIYMYMYLSLYIYILLNIE